MTLLFLVTSILGVKAQRSLDEQLNLRFDENYITQLKDVNPAQYRFYAQELLYSYEFVDLEEGITYPVLEAYDYHSKVSKEAPVFINFKTFSLYDYKYHRHPSDDIIYKIPNATSAKGIKIYSKEKFRSKL